MAIRLEQIHPMLVHMPIALLPISVGADIVGRMTCDETFLSLGQKTACFAALGAVGSVVTGLIAGEEVNVKGASMDMLITHRNLNVAAAIVTGGMAIWRARHPRPNIVYIATGMIGAGIFTYTGYLGGKLVYETGVGVKPAQGVYRSDAPTLRFEQAGTFARAMATDFVHGMQHMIQEVIKGKIVPSIIEGKQATDSQDES